MRFSEQDFQRTATRHNSNRDFARSCLIQVLFVLLVVITLIVFLMTFYRGD